MLEIDEIAVKSPRAELHVAVLNVKWIIFDVDGTVAFVDHRWLPDDFAIELYGGFGLRGYLIVAVSAFNIQKRVFKLEYVFHFIWVYILKYLLVVTFIELFCCEE